MRIIQFNVMIFEARCTEVIIFMLECQDANIRLDKCAMSPPYNVLPVILTENVIFWIFSFSDIFVTELESSHDGLNVQHSC